MANRTSIEWAEAEAREAQDLLFRYAVIAASKSRGQRVGDGGYWNWRALAEDTIPLLAQERQNKIKELLDMPRDGEVE